MGLWGAVRYPQNQLKEETQAVQSPVHTFHALEGQADLGTYFYWLDSPKVARSLPLLGNSSSQVTGLSPSGRSSSLPVQSAHRKWGCNPQDSGAPSPWVGTAQGNEWRVPEDSQGSAPPGDTPSLDIGGSFAHISLLPRLALLFLAGRTEESPRSPSPHRRREDHAAGSGRVAPRCCGTGRGTGTGPPLAASPVGSPSGQMASLRPGHVGCHRPGLPAGQSRTLREALSRQEWPPLPLQCSESSRKGKWQPRFWVRTLSFRQ